LYPSRLAGKRWLKYNSSVSFFGRHLYWFSRNSVLLAAKLLWKISYIDTANIPKTGPLIIASNHASHLDPPLIGAGVPRKVTFIAKQELFSVPFVGWWMKQIGQISVARGGGGKEALATAEEVLRNDGCIIIFPEGTRTKSGRMQRGRTGVAVLALRTGAPVIPAAVEGTFEAFGHGKKIPKPGRVTVQFGKPLTFGQHIAADGTYPRAALEEVTSQIMLEIQRMLPEKRRPAEGEVPPAQTLSGNTG